MNTKQDVMNALEWANGQKTNLIILRRMKKIILWFVAYVFFITTLIVVLSQTIIGEVKMVQEQYKSEIGNEIVISNDTLTIIDYSYMMETFTLSNGVVVNSQIVFNTKSNNDNNRTSKQRN